MPQLGDIGSDTDLYTTNPIPVGTIIPFAGQSSPSGWTLCNGVEVTRASALGTFLAGRYGSGNGTTTYNTPDMRDKHPLGKTESGTASTLGATGGSLAHSHGVGSFSNASHDHTNSTLVLPAHSHGHTMSLSAHSHTLPQLAPGVAGSYSDGGVNTTDPTGNASPGIAGGVSNSSAASVSGRTAGSGAIALTGTTGTGEMPYQTANYIIKN